MAGHRQPELATRSFTFGLNRLSADGEGLRLAAAAEWTAAWKAGEPAPALMAWGRALCPTLRIWDDQWSAIRSAFAGQVPFGDLEQVILLLAARAAEAPIAHPAAYLRRCLARAVGGEDRDDDGRPDRDADDDAPAATTEAPKGLTFDQLLAKGW